MKAVRMYAPRDLRVEEVDIPSYEADECLIKVMAVGVCGSDIPRVNQYGAHVSPIMLGHEFLVLSVNIVRWVNILFVKTTIIMVQEEMVHLHNISQ